jgi:hypothetical protein
LGVLNWLGKVLGGDAGVPDGVPAAWAQQLSSVFERADKLDHVGRSGLGRDLVGYVLREDPIAVLNEIANSGKVAVLLGLGGYYPSDTGGAKARALYATIGDVPPPIVVRWGRLLAASIGRSNAAWLLNLPAGAEWVEALMAHAGGNGLYSTGQYKPRCELSMAVVETALAFEELPQATLLVACFATPVNSYYGVGGRGKVAASMPGFAAAMVRHREAVRPHLLPAAVDQRLHVLEMLGALDDSALENFAQELADHAASSSKQVRAAVEPIARRIATAMVAPLKGLAVAGKPEQRLHAMRMLWEMARASGDAAVVAWAREAALADKAASVQALVSEWSAKDEAIAVDSDRYDYVVPTTDWNTPLDPALSRAIDNAMRGVNSAIEQANERARVHHERAASQGHRFALHQEKTFSASELSSLRATLEAPKPTTTAKVSDRRSWNYIDPALRQLAADPVVSPAALLKLCAAFDLLQASGYGYSAPALSPAAAGAFDIMHRRQQRPTLLELSQMLDDIGLDGGGMVLARYTHAFGAVAADWDREAVWPFFAHHVDKLIKALGSAERGYWFNREALYRAIATLPTPPAAVVNALFDLALGSSRTDRSAAQAALHAFLGKEARIVNALADGKSETRAIAAQWLGRLKHFEAIAALEKAVVKEKHDVAKGAMLDALQAMGQPVERYLDRDALSSEAAKSLAKGLPKELEWFPWAALPSVRWADSGAPVPSEVLRWLMAQAVRQKLPEPNAILRKYCAMFVPRDREAFGQFVLEAWLGEDIRPIDPEVATKQAHANATALHQSIQSHPQYYDAALKTKSLDELFAQLLPGLLRQPAGSAIGSKGLLAVVAACGAERVAPPVQRYLKAWYGTRAAQGKALIAMLAWVEHPSAIQLMLSVGSRFRTKSFQEEATRQAQALADRRGWTLDELADRTMPSAGFDEVGELELSFGERVFTARLLPDFKIELFNPEGKKIAALPEPRQDDDAERAKDAKKALSAAKKELKSIVDLQSDRLYEALCTGRDWSFEDWNAYLNRHAVVRRLVQRVVWSLVENDLVVATFRPLDDGTLTDSDDNAVVPPAAARVRIAHDSNLPAETVQTWQRHLKDYEIKPLFQQFGKGTWTLPEAKRGETEVLDFEGHLLDAFALRGRATKLGYSRGPTEDGGWFMTYEKRFPTLGLVTVIEFTGNPLPEENRTVALMHLRFENAGVAAGERTTLALGKVPPVLLSECYNDLRLIAAEGSGFDPEWQKKSEY